MANKVIPDAPWYNELTPSEAKLIAQLETIIECNKKAMREASQSRWDLQNRALGRIRTRNAIQRKKLDAESLP